MSLYLPLPPLSLYISPTMHGMGPPFLLDSRSRACVAALAALGCLGIIAAALRLVGRLVGVLTRVQVR